MYLRALQDTGSFSVLSANVAGLPAIFSSGNPSQNTVELGRRLNGWDIVNVQEDFNYHADLYQGDAHPYRTPTSGGVPFGSGLNTMSKFPFTDIGGLDRVKWSQCSTFDGADCLTPKGFTYVQVEIVEGVIIDIYNLHADAGTTSADCSARQANINQLIDYILANSADAPVIVFGDTNTRYTRVEDNIRDLTTRAGLTDSWVSYVENGTPPAAGAPALSCPENQLTNACEVVDKIFFRGSRFVNLQLVNFNTERTGFLDGAGNSLSDHVPISSTFSWTLTPGFRQSSAVGGPHGTPFTDIAKVLTGQRVSVLSIRAAARVDAVSLTVGGVVLSHGGTGGDPQTLVLNAGEYVQSVELHWGQKNGHTRIFFASFSTNLQRTLTGGSRTSSTRVFTAPAGWQIAGFHGRSAAEMDALGVIYTPVV